MIRICLPFKFARESFICGESAKYKIFSNTSEIRLNTELPFYKKIKNKLKKLSNFFLCFKDIITDNIDILVNRYPTI